MSRAASWSALARDEALIGRIREIGRAARHAILVAISEPDLPWYREPQMRSRPVKVIVPES